jgi:hypothetical protein
MSSEAHRVSTQRARSNCSRSRVSSWWQRKSRMRTSSRVRWGFARDDDAHDVVDSVARSTLCRVNRRSNTSAASQIAPPVARSSASAKTRNRDTGWFNGCGRTRSRGNATVLRRFRVHSGIESVRFRSGGKTACSLSTPRYKRGASRRIGIGVHGTMARQLLSSRCRNAEPVK